MQTSKLHYYLSRLTWQEWESLCEYAATPILNKEPALARFLKVYQSSLPLAPEKEDFYAQLFPGKPFKSGHLRVLMTKTLELTYDFISWQRFQQQGILKRTLLIQELNRRHWKKFFLKTHDRLLKTLRKEAASDEYYYWRKIELDSELYAFNSRAPRRSGDRGLQPFIDSLDNYYLITKLTLACLAINQSQVLPTHFEMEGMDQLVAGLQNRRADLSPLTRIYYLIYKTLTESGGTAETYYQELKKGLFQHSGNYGQKQVLGLFTYAINFCNRQFRQGNTAYQAEGIELYRHLLEEEILLEKGKMLPFFYKDIVRRFAVMGSQTGDFSWVDTFVTRYATRLTDAAEGRYLQLNQAVILFYKTDYLGAARLLNLLWREFEDELYRLDARAYLLMCYYELEVESEWESWQAAYQLNDFDKEWNAFRMYLDRNKEIATPRKKGFKLFAESMRQLKTAIGKPYAEMKKRFGEIQARLAEGGPAPHKQWLLKQMDQEIS